MRTNRRDGQRHVNGIHCLSCGQRVNECRDERDERLPGVVFRRYSCPACGFWTETYEFTRLAFEEFADARNRNNGLGAVATA